MKPKVGTQHMPSIATRETALPYCPRLPFMAQTPVGLLNDDCFTLKADGSGATQITQLGHGGVQGI